MVQLRTNRLIKKNFFLNNQFSKNLPPIDLISSKLQNMWLICCEASRQTRNDLEDNSHFDVSRRYSLYSRRGRRISIIIKFIKQRWTDLPIKSRCSLTIQSNFGQKVVQSEPDKTLCPSVGQSSVTGPYKYNVHFFLSFL
jgi:hypothetical protein